MKKAVKITSVVLCLLLLTLSFTACSDTAQQSGENEEVIMNATISVEGFGDIKLELYPDIAPQSVYNFVYLARQGFYDGLIFHRIAKNFVIQGGAYETNGSMRERDDYTIYGEFDINGFNNTLAHERGVISWARVSYPYDSATSQFFICLEDDTTAQLDGSYAAFGKVVDGMDVVDAIAAVDINGETPLENIVITKVTVEGPELPEPTFLYDTLG